MYELTLSQTVTLAQVIDRILTAAAAAEVAIYCADDWFQAHIAQAVETWVRQMAIAQHLRHHRTKHDRPCLSRLGRFPASTAGTSSRADKCPLMQA